MNNMYVAGIDSIDIGQKDTSEATKDPSDFCIVIKKRVIGTGTRPGRKCGHQRQRIARTFGRDRIRRHGLSEMESRTV